MVEQRVEVPQSLWERLRARPALLAAIAVVLVLVLGGVAYLVARSGADGGSHATVSELEDIDGSGDLPGADAPGAAGSDATRTSDATGAGGASASEDGEAAEQDGSADGSTSGSDADGEPSQAPGREPFVAYRKDGALWVAREDGTDPRQVAAVGSGAFALAPDARTLAYVDAADERLHLVDLAGEKPKDTDVGPAKDVRLAWSDDSSLLAYTRMDSAFRVCVIGRDGTGDRVIGSGHSPDFSADGTRLAFVSNSVPGQTGSVVIATIGGSAGGVGVRANEVVWGGDGLIVAVAREGAGSARLITVREDGSAPRELQGIPEDDGRPVTYANLCASPDGRTLAYAIVGDDGYSRTQLMSVQDAEPVPLSTRRDTYPLCWSADGDRLFFVEGNAFQGEATTLASVGSDGTGRADVVSGAGR